MPHVRSRKVIDARPRPRTGLVVLRRAMWPNARESGSPPMRLRVSFARRPPVWLDELGNWESA